MGERGDGKEGKWERGEMRGRGDEREEGIGGKEEVIRRVNGGVN